MSEVSQAVAAGAHRTDKYASSNQDPHAEFHVPMSTYLMVFIALMVLLVVTVTQRVQRQGWQLRCRWGNGTSTPVVGQQSSDICNVGENPSRPPLNKCPMTAVR